MTDQEVTRQLREGNKRALNQLFDQYYTILVHYAIKIITDPVISEEIVQDVFISIWKNREKSEILAVRPYLTRAVKNRCINHIKSNHPMHDEMESAMFVASDTGSDDTLQYQELSQVLEDARKKLPKQTDLIFCLSRFSDMTYDEIATELDVSVKTVEYHISKAIKLLRGFIDLHGFVFLALALAF